MNENYLIHYGTPRHSGRYPYGSGERPYQGVENTQNKKEKQRKPNNKWFDQTIKGGKDKPNISPAEKVAKEVGNVAGSTKNMAESVNRIKKDLTPHRESIAKKLTDKELRDAINRIELEKRYDSLTTQETSRGYEVLKNSLDIVGGIASTAASVAAIYAVVNKIW